MNEQHASLLRYGAEAWNHWRVQDPMSRPLLGGLDLREDASGRVDLRGADLSGADLRGAYLREAVMQCADLSGADLSDADLCSADLEGAKLAGANLRGANLGFANLRRTDLRQAVLQQCNLVGADLREARAAGADLRSARLIGAGLRDTDLSGADLGQADLGQANLSRANLSGARLVDTCMARAMLSGACVYGISAWGLELEGASQEDLVVSGPGGPLVTVDHLETAQLITLLLHGRRIGEVVASIESSFVLVIGRFAHERQEILHRVRAELRLQGFSPLSLDVESGDPRRAAETAAALSRLSRFIIFDITGCARLLDELKHENLGFSTAYVQPLRQSLQNRSDGTPGMEESWRLPLIQYGDADELLSSLRGRMGEFPNPGREPCPS